MIEITHRIGKLGADFIDTTAQHWGLLKPEDDPTSPLWIKKSDPTWRDDLREKMRDEHDSGLDGWGEPEIEEPLFED